MLQVVSQLKLLLYMYHFQYLVFLGHTQTLHSIIWPLDMFPFLVDRNMDLFHSLLISRDYEKDKQQNQIYRLKFLLHQFQYELPQDANLLV